MSKDGLWRSWLRPGVALKQATQWTHPSDRADPGILVLKCTAGEQHYLLHMQVVLFFSHCSVASPQAKSGHILDLE